MRLVKVYFTKERFMIPFLLLVVFITYRGIWSIYFQQDEWFWFKKILYFDHQSLFQHFQVVSNHFVPFFSLQFDLMMRFFSFDPFSYGIYNLLFHSINTILVFLVGKRITNNKQVGFLGALLFATAATPFQAVIWYGTSPMSLPATTFGLLSLLFFGQYMQDGKKHDLIITLVLLVTGCLFYENLIGMFLFIISWAAVEKKFLKDTTIWSLGMSILYVVCRSTLQVTQGITIRTSYGIYLFKIIHNVFAFPFIGFSQLFIPSVLFYQLSLLIAKFYTDSIIANLGDWVRPFLTVDSLMAVFFSCVSILLFLGMIRIVRNMPKVKEKIILLLIFIFVNLLPFTLLPNGGLESRHFYFSTVGASLLIAVIIWNFYKKINSQLGKIFLVLLCMGYIGLNIYEIRTAVHQLVAVSREREMIVQSIRTTYKRLPKRVAFFSTTALPFQSGVGEMLMVQYNKQWPYYVFFNSEFLTHMGEEGYQEKNGIGFGYFYTFQELKDAYLRNKMHPFTVYAFQWDPGRNILIDKSKEIREKLSMN